MPALSFNGKMLFQHTNLQTSVKCKTCLHIWTKDAASKLLYFQKKKQKQRGSLNSKIPAVCFPTLPTDTDVEIRESSGGRNKSPVVHPKQTVLHQLLFGR